MSEAHRMAEVYAVFYAFENSLREFVDGHLTSAVGADWWEDPKIVSRAVRDTVERNQAAEGRFRFHSKRKARPIYYSNLGHLATITESDKGWTVFKSLLPSQSWLHGLVEKAEASRNVVAHMNPLQKRDIRRINQAFEDWLAQIEGNGPPAVP